jgi:very-short-patch-repair endonuclease
VTQPARHRDAAVAALAGTQRTIVSHEQLVALGCTRRVVAHWVNRGRLHVRFPGVYSLVDGELPPLAHEQAALMACGKHAYLSHASSAFVWGLSKTRPAVVEVSVVGRYRRSSHGILVHRIRAIDRREVKRHEGLWVSSPARAVLELAATGTADELTRAIDEGLAHRLFTPNELRAVLARNRPCRGAARLDAILGDETATAISRSRKEKRLLRGLRDAGLPLPETNVKLGRFEADFLWRRERLVVEVDGYPFHRGPAAYNRDHDKDLAFREAGLDVLRFTGDHVEKRLTMVLVKIAGELARLAVAD